MDFFRSLLIDGIKSIVFWFGSGLSYFETWLNFSVRIKMWRGAVNEKWHVMFIDGGRDCKQISTIKRLHQQKAEQGIMHFLCSCSFISTFQGFFKGFYWGFLSIILRDYNYTRFILMVYFFATAFLNKSLQSKDFIDRKENKGSCIL